MSVESNSGENKIAVSFGTLMDNSSIVASARSALSLFETHMKRVTDAGLDGVQWLPFKFPIMAGMQMKAGFVEPLAAKKILALEQSFQSAKRLGDVRKHEDPKLAFLAFVTMQERVSSVRALVKLQRSLGRLPTVLYPPLADESPYPGFHALANRLVQPTKAFVDQWVQGMPGFRALLPVTEQLDRARIDAGFHGYALDTLHFREAGGPLADWPKTLPSMLALNRLVHVRIGQNGAELADLLEGTEKTDLPAILKAIRDSGWKGTYVIEAPAVEFYAANAQKRRVPENNVVGGSLQLIGHNIRKLTS